MYPEARRTIIKAAKQGDAAAVIELLAQDQSLVGVRGHDGSTPLHCAAWEGHPIVVSVLLDAGADINDHNHNRHWGTTPLHAAAHGNQKAVAEILLRRGADTRAENLHGRTPMDETRIHNATAVARLLEETLRDPHGDS